VELRTSYVLHEGGTRDVAISTTRFSGDGRVQEIHWMQNSGAPPFVLIPGTEE
jgi:glutamate synthase (NADPH/NADH) small chain